MPKKLTTADLIREHAFAYDLDPTAALADVGAAGTPARIADVIERAQIGGSLPERESAPLTGAAASERCRSELAKLSFERSRRYDRGVRNRSLIAGYQSVVNAALSLHPEARLTDTNGDPREASADYYIDEHGQFLFGMFVHIPYLPGGHLETYARMFAADDRSLVVTWDAYVEYATSTDNAVTRADFETAAKEHARVVNQYLSAVYTRTRVDYR